MTGPRVGSVRSLAILFLTTTARGQDINVFLTPNNLTVDKKATISQPFINIEDIEGYSICFRNPKKVKFSQALI